MYSPTPSLSAARQLLCTLTVFRCLAQCFWQFLAVLLAAVAYVAVLVHGQVLLLQGGATQWLVCEAASRVWREMLPRGQDELAARPGLPLGGSHKRAASMPG
jgi:hypothetical protein